MASFLVMDDVFKCRVVFSASIFCCMFDPRSTSTHEISSRRRWEFQCYFIVKTSDRMSHGSRCCRIDTTLSHSVHSQLFMISESTPENEPSTTAQRDAVPGGNERYGEFRCVAMVIAREELR